MDLIPAINAYWVLEDRFNNVEFRLENNERDPMDLLHYYSLPVARLFEAAMALNVWFRILVGELRRKDYEGIAPNSPIDPVYSLYRDWAIFKKHVSIVDDAEDGRAHYYFDIRTILYHYVKILEKIKDWSLTLVGVKYPYLWIVYTQPGLDQSIIYTDVDDYARLYENYIKYNEYIQHFVNTRMKSITYIATLKTPLYSIQSEPQHTTLCIPYTIALASNPMRRAMEFVM